MKIWSYSRRSFQFGRKIATENFVVCIPRHFVPLSTSLIFLTKTQPFIKWKQNNENQY